MELLQVPADGEVLTAIEQAIEAKATAENIPVDLAANALFNTAALAKIQGAPPSWLGWFQQVEKPDP